MTDFDQNDKDAVEIFAMTGSAKKRVEVNERKMTNGTEKLLGRAKEAALQSWLDQSVRRCAHDGCKQRSSDERSTGDDMEVHKQSRGTPLCPGMSRPSLERGCPRQPHTFCSS